MVLHSRWKVRWTWGKGLLVLSWAAVAALAFYWGRCASLSQAHAAEPSPASPMPPDNLVPTPPAPPPPGSSDYASQPVAYVYGAIPITRADLGEYLIARFGADRLDALINRRIIDHVCQEKGIEVTAAEVENALAEDLKGLNVDKLDFVKKILKHYNKTLYEWKEDVIKPRLMLAKLCRDRITITDEDLRNAFEALYGEKVHCRLIMWKREEKHIALQKYAKIRDNAAEFDREAKMQASPSLAAVGGLTDPIGRHVIGNDELEKVIFGLQPGELSPVQETPDGIVVFKCVERLPPDASKKLADVQPELEKKILDKKIQLTIPIVFKEMRDQAKVQRLLQGYKTQAEVEKEVEEELREAGHIDKKLAPPQGN
jgi:parvulin-like peptidyl-prolyl isomerase